MLVCRRGRDIISSTSCCVAALPGELRVYTLFGIAHGKVVTGTRSPELSIDSTIRFAPDFILEMMYRRYTG